MIKKLIGIIVAVAVIVIVVIAAIRRDNFQSMLLRDEIENQTFPGPVDTDQPAAPVAGEIVAVNDALADTPEAVNSEPYASWMFKIKPANAADVDGLLSAADYDAANA